MYNDGQVLGTAVTTTGAVAALPLTAGNTVFQTILIAVAVVAATVLVVRIIRLTAERQAR